MICRNLRRLLHRSPGINMTSHNESHFESIALFIDNEADLLNYVLYLISECNPETKTFMDEKVRMQALRGWF